VEYSTVFERREWVEVTGIKLQGFFILWVVDLSNHQLTVPNIPAYSPQLSTKLQYFSGIGQFGN
jgi:hypothetical protein